MGRFVEHYITGLACNRRSCSGFYAIVPHVPVGTHWSRQIGDLQNAVDNGWSIVLGPKIRTYCPQHAYTATSCSCSRQPKAMKYCLFHNDENLKNLWYMSQVPDEVQEYLGHGVVPVF